MSNRRLLIVSLLGIGLVLIVIAATFIVSGSRRGASSFPLPTPNRETPSPSSGGFDSARIEVRITRENVQQVIKTLARPETYTREVLVETFWGDGSSQTSFTAAVSPLGVSLRSSVRDTQKNIVIKDGEISIWYGDRDSVLKLPADSPAAPDKYQMLLTYEDILALPASVILDAGYFPGGDISPDYDGDTLIYVKYRDGLFGYLTECFVSVQLGLLVSAEAYDGDALVYRMNAGKCQVGAVDEALFAVPAE
jgi:hypothetical protein